MTFSLELHNRLMRIIKPNGIRTTAVDSSGRESFNGVFGDQFVAQRKPMVSSNFTYTPDMREVIITQVNSATVANVGNLLTLTSGTNAAGSTSIQSRKNVRYQAGRDAEVMFTGRFDAGISNNTRKLGIFDVNDGFWFGLVGVDFGIGVRRAGSDTFILKSAWNADKCDGTGASGFVLDTSNINIYRISYGYLGVAPICFQVYGGKNNGWITAHIYDISNNTQTTHIASPYLPIRAENTNTGNTTSVKVQSASVYCGTIDGSAAADSSSREFSARLSIAGVTAGTDKVIVIFHNKETFASVANKVQDLLLKVGIGVDGTKTVNVSLYKLASTPTGTSFTSVDATNSNMEYSTAGTISLTGAQLLNSWALGKTDSVNENVTDYNLLLNPDEYAVFTFTSTGTSDIEFVNRWSELF